MHDRNRLAVLLVHALAFVGAPPGCGSAVSSTDDPAIAVIHGHVTGQVTGVAHALRAVLVWRSPDQSENLAVQETNIEPQLPATFALNVTERPPAAVLRTIAVPGTDRTIVRATGTIAVYEDLNDNGRFDLVPPGAFHATDRLLSDGNSAQVSIVYYEGSADDIAAAKDGLMFVDISDDALVPPHPGFNIYDDIGAAPATGDGCVNRPCAVSDGPIEWFQPPRDEVELEMNVPAFSVVQCQKADFVSVFGPLSTCPENKVPDGWGMLCSGSDGHDIRAVVVTRVSKPLSDERPAMVSSGPSPVRLLTSAAVFLR
jgi:hypothetical protein